MALAGRARRRLRELRTWDDPDHCVCRRGLSYDRLCSRVRISRTRTAYVLPEYRTNRTGVRFRPMPSGRRVCHYLQTKPHMRHRDVRGAKRHGAAFHPVSRLIVAQQVPSPATSRQRTGAHSARRRVRGHDLATLSFPALRTTGLQTTSRARGGGQRFTILMFVRISGELSPTAPRFQFNARVRWHATSVERISEHFRLPLRGGCRSGLNDSSRFPHFQRTIRGPSHAQASSMSMAEEWVVTFDFCGTPGSTSGWNLRPATTEL